MTSPATAAGPMPNQVAEGHAIDEGEEPDPAKPREIDVLTHAEKGDREKEDQRADGWTNEEKYNQDCEGAHNARFETGWRGNRPVHEVSAFPQILLGSGTLAEVGG